MLIGLAEKVDSAIAVVGLTSRFYGFGLVEPAHFDAGAVNVPLLVKKVFFYALGPYLRQFAIIFLIRHDVQDQMRRVRRNPCQFFQRRGGRVQNARTGRCKLDLVQRHRFFPEDVVTIVKVTVFIEILSSTDGKAAIGVCTQVGFPGFDFR